MQSASERYFQIAASLTVLSNVPPDRGLVTGFPPDFAPSPLRSLRFKSSLRSKTKKGRLEIANPFHSYGRSERICPLRHRLPAGSCVDSPALLGPKPALRNCLGPSMVLALQAPQAATIGLLPDLSRSPIAQTVLASPGFVLRCSAAPTGLGAL